MPASVLSRALCGIVLSSFCSATALGQGTKADYERAGRLRELTSGKVFKTQVKPHWFAQSKKFWYRNDLREGAREFVLVDVEKGTRRAAFDHDRLAKALSKAAGKPVDAGKLPLDNIQFSDACDEVRFHALGKSWKCEFKDYQVVEDRAAAQTSNHGATASETCFAQSDGDTKADKPPEEKLVAFIKDHNVFLRDDASGAEWPLTRDGTEDHAYAGSIHWSPDRRRFVVMRQTKGQQRKVHLIESSPKDQLQPKLHSHNYRKPGDDIPTAKSHLFDVGRRAEIPVSDDLFPTPWSIGEFRWQRDSRRFTFLYNQRGHEVLRIVAVDAETGEAAAIVDETSKTFVDYSQKKYSQYLDDTSEIIWMSERDGWNHLYLYDARTGEVKNQITRGHWVVRRVDRIDHSQRQIWFQAAGIYPEQDPYYIHFCRINFDGSELVILTSGNGMHSIEYSPDRLHMIDTYSRVDIPPVVELRRTTDGSLVCELERADWSALLATGWQVPERFAAKGRDGKTDIYGVIWRPTTFDAKKKYPVIEKIYAGPQGYFVPKGFSSFYKTQELAELGFIVVQIDGMGTNWRSKAFHDVCSKNLADSGLPDRIAWIKAAANKYPYMDVTRVGIFGGSAGGQSSTQAMLAHGDFYKVAVSDCGCHDNRMDKIWWNEAWMGWPIGPHYEAQSNATNAHRLQGKLLLTVGELDRNVDPASTMQVVNALIKADKDFDMLVVPGAGHGVGETPYCLRRRRDYFVRHLMGVEPRRQ